MTTRFTLAGLTAIAGYGLLYQGAAEETRWAVCQTGIAALALLYGADSMRAGAPKPPALDRWLGWLLAAVFAFAALQLAPLPMAVLRVVAPARAELADSVASIAGLDPGWTPISAAPWSTLAVLQRWLTAGLVLFLVRGISTGLAPGSWWPAIPMVGLTLLEAATGIAQKLVGVTVQGTYGNRNHFAALLDVGLPFALAGAFYLAGRRLAGRSMRAGETIACLCVAPAIAVLALAGIWSLSRMGFIAMTVATAIVFWQALRRSTGRPILSAALLCAALLTGMAAMAPAELVERFAETNSGSAGDNRLALWRETWEMAKASPIAGVGLGAYEPAFLRFKRVAPDRTADYAHNDYLQLLAELGVVGLALVVAAAARILVPLFAKSQRGTDGGQWMRAACLASLAGMGLHSASDYPIYVPGNLVLVAWVLGIAVFQIAHVKQDRRQTDG